LSNPPTDPRRFSFYLAALRELGAALAAESNRVDSRLLLKESLYRVLGTLAIGRGALLLWDAEARRALPLAAKGMRPTRAQAPAFDERQVAALAAGCHPFHPHLPPHPVESAAEALRPLADKHKIHWIVPLGTGTAFVGLLVLGATVAGDPLTRLELEVLEEMASLLALRLEEARVRRQLGGQVRELQRLSIQMRQIYLDTVRALAAVIDGPEAGGRPTHSLRVASLASEMGRRLALSTECCESLYLAGLLHDIGKQIISREILGKTGPLAPHERVAVEAHPATACDLISHLRFPWGDVAEIIRHHHERLDGKGYPDRLAGEQISIEARILMMAEAFDAMTSDQPWRPRLSFERIVEQIQENLGMQFDPATVRALCETIDAGLAGRAVEADFVPHLQAAFDPSLIRTLLAELRREVQNPTLRPSAQIVDLADENDGEHTPPPRRIQGL
jgi:hypothetical protein